MIRLHCEGTSQRREAEAGLVRRAYTGWSGTVASIRLEQWGGVAAARAVWTKPLPGSMQNRAHDWASV